jgi:hypothetical protein
MNYVLPLKNDAFIHDERKIVDIVWGWMFRYWPTVRPVIVEQYYDYMMDVTESGGELGWK